MAFGGHFEEWQEKMRQAAISPNVVVDIGASQQSLYSDSQPTGYTEAPDLYTTEEEFQRLENTPPHNFQDAPPVGSKKKRATRKPAAKKAKKDASVEDQVTDEEGEVAGSRWTDAEVIQLIAFRQEMDEEFDRNAKKQGVHTWDKLQARMVVACENFQKSPDACRKKWKYVYRQYANDMRILQVSGEGRKVSCKFFEDIDQGFNNRANVRKMTHGDARGTPNPCPPDLNGSPQEGEPSAEAGSTLDGYRLIRNWTIPIRVNYDGSPFTHTETSFNEDVFYVPDYLFEPCFFSDE